MDFMLSPLAISMPGVTEWLIIGAIGLLLFGKRLPEVGRSLGKGIVEFKKGLAGIDEDINVASSVQPPTRPQISSPTTQAPGYKFDPYTGKPMDPNATTPPGAA
jgi:sec-independent protein translocase protein TatA